MRRTFLTVLAGVALIAALAFSSSVAAKGPPAGSGHGNGRGGGNGGGGGGETTVPNNLSVPTIMVDGGFEGVTCGTAAPSPLVEPTGDALSGYPLDVTAYYYVQGVHTWQAQCYDADAASATAEWGDNLGGDAKLSVGKPIRVELGLMNSGTGPSMDGYDVVKLDPNALDRESAYGTLAESSTGPASVTSFAANEQRVYDGGATFSIKNDTTGAWVVAEGTDPTAEINATGRVVYGYNLRVSSAGLYTITFNIPTVSITGHDIGSVDSTGHLVSLQIEVTTGGGGGGPKH